MTLQWLFKAFQWLIIALRMKTFIQQIFIECLLSPKQYSGPQAQHSDYN